MKEKIKALLQLFPQSYSEELGIDLKFKGPSEIFKWFLASILFAHRIPENIAKSTFKEFEKEGVITPEKILSTGWEGLVSILDAGKYVRYDFSTASTLLDIMKKLKEKYGSLDNLSRQAKNQKELEEKLQEFKRVGPTTVNIFLRELRDIWDVDPLPSKFTIVAGSNLGLVKSKSPTKVLEELKEIWEKNKIKNKTFVNFETALLRLGKNYCLKNKCKICNLKQFCKK
ncbi:MAG: hypothetical protein QMD14_02495 [Candidatus Aenigmarchaeota archaeon]|nr:hypothetical protein [Candidatus Aenigmarchaeota archaeon]